ncbi:ATP-binding protein [Streptomyces liangshanensis]|uniref:ATP-binding protein n=1 Tax=Streptomyces liangshanensis TaxID=2717324 RepID=A0A6G9GUB1_9ACTN|nr:ATP-binding protein [Streptomyces liangshanensis]QIQ01527.1 ATP-binding protein [Streptomyces liangshanensis]
MTTVDDGADNAVTGAPVWFDARPADAAEARALTRAFLAGHPAPDRTLGDVLLVVSELVTNALRHAGGVTAFRVAVRSGAVEIVVQDASPVPPVAREHRGQWLPGGYGWPLVNRLAEVTVVPLGDDGKIVRASLRRPGP